MYVDQQKTVSQNKLVLDGLLTYARLQECVCVCENNGWALQIFVINP